MVGRETVWPYSVPHTPERQAAVEDAVQAMIERGYDFERGEAVLWDIRAKFRADPKPVINMFKSLLERMENPAVERDAEPQSYVSKTYLLRKMDKHLASIGRFSPSRKKRLATHLMQMIYRLRDSLMQEGRAADMVLDAAVPIAFLLEFQENARNIFLFAINVIYSRCHPR